MAGKTSDSTTTAIIRIHLRIHTTGATLCGATTARHTTCPIRTDLTTVTSLIASTAVFRIRVDVHTSISALGGASSTVHGAYAEGTNPPGLA